MADEAGRRSFRRTAGVGVPLAVLAAVASAKPWRGSGGDVATATLDTAQRAPLASAVSLVLLACWGVLLVTRGRVRRAFAVVALVAALGLVAAVVSGWLTLPGAEGSSLAQQLGHKTGSTGWTGWFWTAAVCAVLSLAPAAVAVRRVGGWPEMGRRYDAPGAASPAPEQPRTERDLWDQLDEGRDPTERP